MEDVDEIEIDYNDTDEFLNKPQIAFALIGDTKVGKTSICEMLVKKECGTEYIPTMAINMMSTLLTYKSTEVKLVLYDMTGDPLQQKLLDKVKDEIHNFIIVYDITNRDSYDMALKYINKYKKKKGLMILIANKNDCTRKDRAVSKYESVGIRRDNNIDFYEVNTRDDGTSINNMFEQALASIVEHEKSRRNEAFKDRTNASGCPLL